MSQYLKKMLNREITFHVERIIKRLLLSVKGLIQVNAKFRVEKIMYTFLSHTKHPFEEHKEWCIKTIVLQYSKNGRIESLYLPKGN